MDTNPRVVRLFSLDVSVCLLLKIESLSYTQIAKGFERFYNGWLSRLGTKPAISGYRRFSTILREVSPTRAAADLTQSIG